MVILAFAGLLVWWGAAVTTKDVGLAVPDWPLSFGKVNPEGWLGKEALLLEHGHRAIASLVGTLTALLFLWIWIRTSISRWAVVAEFSTLCVLLAAIVAGVARGYAFQSANAQAAAGNVAAATGNPVPWFLLAIVCGLLCLGWFAWSWTRRGWPMALKVSGLALVIVEVQAVLGGLRVTEMSDLFGIIHGCFGQVFFCVLLWVTMVTSSSWPEGRPLTGSGAPGLLRVWGGVLFAAVFGQLILGATVRHTHRIGLAADDILTTGGTFLPDWDNADLVLLFAHKAGAAGVSLVVLLFAGFAIRRHDGVSAIRRLALALAVLVGLQACLGILVLQTGKSFWVTNLHVLNGLAILSCAFILFVRSRLATGCERQAPPQPMRSEDGCAGPVARQDSSVHHV